MKVLQSNKQQYAGSVIARANRTGVALEAGSVIAQASRTGIALEPVNDGRH